MSSYLEAAAKGPYEAFFPLLLSAFLESQEALLFEELLLGAGQGKIWYVSLTERFFKNFPILTLF